MTEAETLAVVSGLAPGDPVFVAYEVGNERTARQEREARRARRAGQNLQHLTGKFVGSFRNRWGQLYFTILTPDRDDEETGAQEAYRSINPSVGHLRSLQAL